MAPSQVSSNMKRFVAFTILILGLTILFHLIIPSDLMSVRRVSAAGNRLVSFFYRKPRVSLVIRTFLSNKTNLATPYAVRDNSSNSTSKSPIKRIFCAANFFGRGRKGWESYFPGWNTYKPYHCEDGYRCQWTLDSSKADALIFHGRELDTVDDSLHTNRKPTQRWVFFSWESIVHTNVYRPDFWFNKFNWTATYMRHSHVWTPYYRGYTALTKEDKVAKELYKPSEKVDFAFAVISNCASKIRQDWIDELSRHVKVDVFGKCGRSLNPGLDSVIELSRRYRYYLALENSLCKDYITEKFWGNGLIGHAIPVAYGGLNRTDYEALAPPKSFVYARDFASVSSLANFLLDLAKNEKEYSTYFDWKRKYKIDRYSMKDSVMCGLCRRLHTDDKPSTVNLKGFWNLKSQCLLSDKV